MFRYSFLFLCILLTFSALQPIQAKRFGSSSSRSGGHSYPTSGGLSGGGHRSGGLSGGGGSHSYPSGGSLSGGSHSYPSGGSHTYPSSSGSHTYPSSSGSHTYPSSSGSHTYPSSSGSHTYPSSGNTNPASGAKYPSSGNGYPTSGSGLSGSGTGSHGGKGLSGNTHTSTSTNVHYHYHYNPPTQIRYTPPLGGPAVNYPVYRGSPPTYVYQYKDSGSKYGTLLAGLALLNLGTLAGTAYASRHANYKPQPGEICKFGVKKSNGDYEETKIGCELITSFIFQDQGTTQTSPSNHNTSVVTTSVTNVTTINTGNSQPQPSLAGQTFTMLANGTLVPVNVTTNVTNNGSNVTSTVTVTTTTTTNSTQVTNAIDVKGKEIEVTPGMQCYVIRTTSSSNMKKSVPCGVLQSYATQSLRRNSAGRHGPTIAIMAAIVAVFAVY